MDVSTIWSYISEIKKKKAPDMITNYYGSIYDNFEIEYFLHSDNSIVFGFPNNSLIRVFFYGVREEVACLLKKMPKESVVECISQKQENYDWLQECGYELKEEQLRFINTNMVKIFEIENNLRESVISPTIITASIEDVDGISKLIYKNFNKYSFHYISPEEITSLIEDRLIWVVKENGDIISMALCKFEGRKFYLNYLFNHSDRIKGREVFARAMCEAVDRGYSYGYMWVSKENTRAIHLYQSLLYDSDGTVNSIFVKK